MPRYGQPIFNKNTPIYRTFHTLRISHVQYSSHTPFISHIPHFRKILII